MCDQPCAFLLPWIISVVQFLKATSTATELLLRRELVPALEWTTDGGWTGFTLQQAAGMMGDCIRMPCDRSSTANPPTSTLSRTFLAERAVGMHTQIGELYTSRLLPDSTVCEMYGTWGFQVHRQGVDHPHSSADLTSADYVWRVGTARPLSAGSADGDPERSDSAFSTLPPCSSHPIRNLQASNLYSTHNITSEH
ncbi:hypothetical protein B0H11DRAFT_2426936 [Mycena galericulata]|nr:hypothetical protein B0H11DRAFT_2426936 [Mycena galericulata]